GERRGPGAGGGRGNADDLRHIGGIAAGPVEGQGRAAIHRARQTTGDGERGGEGKRSAESPHVGTAAATQAVTASRQGEVELSGDREAFGSGDTVDVLCRSEDLIGHDGPGRTVDANRTGVYMW